MKNALLALLFILPFTSSAQSVVEITELGVVSQFEMVQTYGPFMQFGVRQYKVVYTSTDLEGEPTELSGLLLVPDMPAWTFPSLIYQHGTVDGPEDVPSNLQGGYELAMVFCGRGFITYAPDYLGLGVSEDFHPYVHAESEARAAIDMVAAGTDGLLQDLSIIPNDQLFVTGYSQGGHAAMAAHKYIQEEDNPFFPDVTAAAPMSGPYDISGTMTDLSLTTTENYSFPSYIVYTALSYNEAYGNLYDNLEEFFRPQYVPMIESFYNDEIGLFALNQFLVDSLTNEYGGSYPYYILQDSISDALINDPNHPANVALADNDLYDWVPEAPTRMFYCMADDQVPFMNSVIAEDAMLANNAPDVDAVDVDPTADHGGCVEPATFATIAFFSGYAEYGPYLSTEEASANGFVIAPNPAGEQVTIELPAPASEPGLINMYDLQGRLVNSRPLAIGDQLVAISLGELPAGMYQLEIRTGGQRFFERLIIR